MEYQLLQWVFFICWCNWLIMFVCIWCSYWTYYILKDIIYYEVYSAWLGESSESDLIFFFFWSLRMLSGIGNMYGSMYPVWSICVAIYLEQHSNNNIERDYLFWSISYAMRAIMKNLLVCLLDMRKLKWLYSSS